MLLCCVSAMHETRSNNLTLAVNFCYLSRSYMYKVHWLGARYWISQGAGRSQNGSSGLHQAHVHTLSQEHNVVSRSRNRFICYIRRNHATKCRKHITDDDVRLSRLWAWIMQCFQSSAVQYITADEPKQTAKPFSFLDECCSASSHSDGNQTLPHRFTQHLGKKEKPNENNRYMHSASNEPHSTHYS
jgi:hypothetical protein